MGLVVQTTANLLPFQLAAESDASGENAPSGVFAELLAALANPGPAPALAAGAPIEMAPASGRAPGWSQDLPPGPAEDASPADGELAGAVQAAIALAAGVPTSVPLEQSPVTGSVLSEAQEASPSTGVALLPAEMSPGEPLEAATPEASVPGEPAVVAGAPSSIEGIETGHDATPQPASRPNSAQIGSAEALPDSEAVTLAEDAESAPASPESLAIAPAGEPGGPPAGEPGVSPPGEPITDAAPILSLSGEPATEASAVEPTPQPSSEPGDGNEQPPGEGESELQGSVVRFAGNAIDRSRWDGPAARGNQPAAVQPDRPTPNASQQGIAHAAAHSAAGQLREAAAPADAPVAGSPAPAAPAEVPPQVEQVGSAILERVEAGGGEATIHLEPAELGEIRIRVRLADGRVHVEVHAGRPESAQLFRDHTVDLTSLLGDRGLDLADVFVGTGDGRGDESRGEGAQQRRRTETGFAELLGLEQQPSGAERHNRLRAAYNPDGAHLFRI